MNIIEQNNKIWNEKVQQGNPWTLPVNGESIAKARKGEWSIIVTATKPVPADWFPPIKDKNILCLASGGGQQGPVLAAAQLIHRHPGSKAVKKTDKLLFSLSSRKPSRILVPKAAPPGMM